MASTQAVPQPLRHAEASSASIYRPHRRTSPASSSTSSSLISHLSRPSARSEQVVVAGTDRTSDPSSMSNTGTPSLGISSQHSSASGPPHRRSDRFFCNPRRPRSQYPRGSSDNHVEYILVASFDIIHGPVTEHQYPVAITGDEHMLAGLMLPEQAHARNQDWTIFFLHRDTSQDDDDSESPSTKATHRRRRGHLGDHADLDTDPFVAAAANRDDLDDWDHDDYDSWSDSEPETGDGPPLVYVLNLVNTKHDKTVKRGAIVRAMAICTRHPFLHIYKPLLLLALEEYFKSPTRETLAMLYNSVNAMDLSLMPKLSLLERQLLLASDNQDLFVEKFEQIIQTRMAEENGQAGSDQPSDGSRSPSKQTDIVRAGTKAHFERQSTYSVPRDTHEFESKVIYKGIPIPIKVPVAVMPETVGDSSLIKLIQNFSETHAKSAQALPLHAHLTTNGPHTHPIIVLVNALLTQKRVVFFGRNMPSGEVAEAVLAACVLASGGVLRGYTRHAFPYTDLTNVDDLLNVPGFIAGVTNPTFDLHQDWWDVLFDLSSRRIRISDHIEPAPMTKGMLYFQQQNPAVANLVNLASASGGSGGGGGGSSGGSSNSVYHDATGDISFMADIARTIAGKHGERAVRAKWRDWITKFTRIAAAFEESVYGASALYRGGDELESGHGYVWCDEAAKQRELAANIGRIEGWRNTRSYYSAIQDLAQLYTIRPLKGLDLHHMHDRLRTQRLTPTQSREIYMALARRIYTYDEICLLLTVAPESQSGLFYMALGLFHKDREVRVCTADLLERIAEHAAGRHWWQALSRFERLAHARIRRDIESKGRAREGGEAVGVALGAAAPLYAFRTGPREAVVGGYASGELEAGRRIS